MADAASDRLSDLPDDLLIHILSSLPSHEAARTTALSRRWRRQLWRDTATANLDYRSCRGAGNALHSLRSGGRVIKKFTVTMPDREWDTPNWVMTSAFEDGVEEARIEWQDGGCPHYTFAAPSPWSPCYDLNLSLDSLTRVRVLDLTGCNLGRTHPAPPPGQHVVVVVFPCLEALRLRRCAVELDTLQAMVYAAPKLSDLCLESLGFLRDITSSVDHRMPFRLSCPAVAVLVMVNLHVLNSTGTSDIGDCRVEVDAPHLRRLHYAQSMSSDDTAFSFVSPTPRLEHVHLATHSKGMAPLRRSMLAPVVSHLRFLKLTAYSIPDLARDDLPVFPRLDRLEIEELCGWCNNNNHVVAAATTVVCLLYSCPAARELRLKFSWLDYLHETVSDPTIQTAAIADFKPCRCDDNNDEDYSCFDVHLGLPRFMHDRISNCSLRRVVVEFDMGELTCLQVWLIRFLVQNVMGLKEMVVEGDEGYDSSWIDWKVASWRYNKGSSAAEQ
ncbi:hypothetical protein D1007_42445 [Hordeum vulgare]|nr:hypothetical protein D1007_42445 [Hordeum vulgare]